MTLDLVYVAWNRLAFTERTFELLLENTDWSLVRRLHVYDDGSTDGTLDYLASRIHQCPGSYVLHDGGGLGSPVGVMNDYLESQARNADYFAKVDNDIAMPAGWLEAAVSVMERSEGTLDLLGLAAGWTGTSPAATPGWDHSTHIGGVGLMRVSAFEGRLPIGFEGRQGFTQWQHRHQRVRAGWIIPDVQAVQLDLIPVDPYASLAAEYRARGWQRQWPSYAWEAEHWKWVLE